jgi:hypothetical protein
MVQFIPDIITDAIPVFLCVIHKNFFSGAYVALGHNVALVAENLVRAIVFKAFHPV